MWRIGHLGDSAWSDLRSFLQWQWREFARIPTVWRPYLDISSSFRPAWDGGAECFVPLMVFIHIICVYIYIYGPVIRYVYSVDYVTCSIYVCICAAAILAILVLSATFELTEWKGADQCSGVFIRFKSPNSLFMVAELRFWYPAVNV